MLNSIDGCTIATRKSFAEFLKMITEWFRSRIEMLGGPYTIVLDQQKERHFQQT